MRDLDLEVTSEFLLIAATLIQLKARFLLPGDSDIDIDEELALAEERDRLLARLLACLTFKDVAAVLKHRMAGNARYVPRMAGLDPNITPAPPELHLTIGPGELAILADRVINRVLEEPELDHLELDLPSVDDALQDLRRRLGTEALTEFDALVEHCRHPMQVIAYFLALLELARWGVVRVDQEHSAAPITIEHDPAAASAVDHIETEWD